MASGTLYGASLLRQGREVHPARAPGRAYEELHARNESGIRQACQRADLKGGTLGTEPETMASRLDRTKKRKESLPIAPRAPEHSHRARRGTWWTTAKGKEGSYLR